MVAFAQHIAVITLKKVCWQISVFVVAFAQHIMTEMTFVLRALSFA